MNVEEAEYILMAKYETTASFMFFARYFYKKRFNQKMNRWAHQEIIAETLEKVVKGEIKRLIINLPPRYGKTDIAVRSFMAYCFALNPSAKFIHTSYANELALDNSEAVKDIIKSDAFQKLFPTCRIKQGTDSKHKWYTSSGGGVYATAAGGQVTGFGAGKVDEDGAQADPEMDEFLVDLDKRQEFAGALIIDDPIKPEDADSKIIRSKVNSRFDSTIRNRVNSRNTPIIIIMQRLHEDDLCGHILSTEAENWHVLKLSAITADGQALCEAKHTLAELREMQKLNPVIFARQYMQDAASIEGRLYKTFKTYSELPLHLPKKKAVIDTADTGNDYLCSIVYARSGQAVYLLDVYYTQSGMEVTEPHVAHQMSSYEVNEVRVESNAGGRAFARNIERIMREKGNFRTSVHWFHQTKNKLARIFTQAAEVQNMIYYPEDWQTRWPLFSRAIKSYQAEGGNSHDDGPDALTMVVEAEKLSNYQILTS